MDGSGNSTGVAADDFRGMMSGFPTGVTVVTATDPTGAPRGMTCSSVCSVSLEPPVLLACLRAGSPTLDAVLASGGFAVNLLHQGARGTAELFASGNAHRFDLVDWSADGPAAGPHLADGAHCVADCALLSAQEVGDHVVVYGRTHRITRLRDTVPLLYALRRYHDWAGAAGAPVAGRRHAVPAAHTAPAAAPAAGGPPPAPV